MTQNTNNVKSEHGARVNGLDGFKFMTVLEENSLDSKIMVELSKSGSSEVVKKKKKGNKGIKTTY